MIKYEEICYDFEASTHLFRQTLENIVILAIVIHNSCATKKILGRISTEVEGYCKRKEKSFYNKLTTCIMLILSPIRK